MSGIYFHTQNKTARLSGSERAHFGVFCNDLAWCVLRQTAEGSNPSLKKIFPTTHYVHHARDFEENARVSFAVGMSDDLCLADRKINPFSLSLNTAFALGNDAVKLAARIHGQCEIHCWLAGVNRQWLVGIVEQGLKCGFYRTGMGWDEVIELLKEDNENPVVLSYSVCDSFPNSYVAGWVPPISKDGEPDCDAWYDLPEDDQWRLAFDGLVASGRGLELTPTNWNEFFFNDGYTALDLVRDL